MTQAVQNLDDPGAYAALDPSGMGGRIAGLPEQCRRAWQMALRLRLPSEYAQVERVAVLGMGGSAIGGDLLADLASLEPSPPIAVVRDYALPPYVDWRTLVIASSYSGNTEETLAAFQQAVDRGARVLAVTGGGQLARRCRELGVPLLPVDCPGEPRSALGYAFLAPLAILSSLGHLSAQTEAVQEGIALLERQRSLWGVDVPRAQNAAKGLAQRLVGRVPVAYGAGVFTGVARRWKSQFNENAKTWAIHDTLPELDHNSVVGYGLPAAMARGAYVVLLQPVTLHPRTALRYRLTAQLLEEAGVSCQVIQAEGRSPLAQMLYAIYLGDYASYYLAILNGVDPSPVPAIDDIKRQLAEGAG